MTDHTDMPTVEDLRAMARKALQGHDLIGVSLVILAVAVPLAVVIAGGQLIKSAAKQCADRGGVQVKAYNGFVCLGPVESKRR